LKVAPAAAGSAKGRTESGRRPAPAVARAPFAVKQRRERR